MCPKDYTIKKIRRVANHITFTVMARGGILSQTRDRNNYKRLNR